MDRGLTALPLQSPGWFGDLASATDLGGSCGSGERRHQIHHLSRAVERIPQEGGAGPGFRDPTMRPGLVLAQHTGSAADLPTLAQNSDQRHAQTICDLSPHRGSAPVA